MSTTKRVSFNEPKEKVGRFEGKHSLDSDEESDEQQEERDLNVSEKQKRIKMKIVPEKTMLCLELSKKAMKTFVAMLLSNMPKLSTRLMLSRHCQKIQNKQQMSTVKTNKKRKRGRGKQREIKLYLWKKVKIIMRELF
ncbi:uncharacterized protein LOC124442242 [Xenia sp. Carnegie-2017]|uniref:uncharacterized protein LOC124442242 n=1 Tax=Xenia sp. Carnegie-2017 TaxID=2897299 RepID=UPI001F037CA5|nr:uncharacterized protein LOC124442242 [Xenia sp. Carnegie-2017]